MRHRFCAAALAAVLLLSATPLSPAASAVFSDAEGTWATGVIEKARGYDLMNGYPDGTFGVGRELTRGESVAVFCRMLGWDATSPGALSFSDCPTSHWAYSYVETTLTRGVIDAGDASRLEDYISREEMAVILVQALGYGTLAQSLPGLEPPFDGIMDNRGYITITYDIGMITDVVGAGGQLEFLSRDSATQEEVAAIPVRVHERHTFKLNWLHGFYAFSSYSQIDLIASMDVVSVGWAQMRYNPATGSVLSSSRTNGSDWVHPDDPTPATDYWDARSLLYNSNVYVSADGSIPLPDGTTTSTVAAVTRTPEIQVQAVAALAATSTDYASLTIGFEGLKGDIIKLNYVTFLKEPDAVLPQGKTLYARVRPGIWYTGFGYRSTNKAADKVILMARGYQWTSVPDSYVGTTNTDSPVTPLASVYEALRNPTDPATGVADRSKLALQISSGSTGFHVDGGDCLLETTIYYPASPTLALRLAQPDTRVVYLKEFRDPYALYTTENGSRYKVWCENERSVLGKVALTRTSGITRVSLWRTDSTPADSTYGVWNALLTRR